MAERPPRLLCLWQPWAELCVWPMATGLRVPIKGFETRHWRPPFDDPLRIVIHATKKRTPEIRAAIDEFGDFLAMRSVERPLSFGCIVGLVTVQRYLSTDGMSMAHTPLDALEGRDRTNRLLGNFSPGRFAWELIDPLPLMEPIPFMGMQGGLLPVPMDLRDQIAQQVGPRALTLTRPTA